MNSKLKIIVADDHPVFREGMADALRKRKIGSKISLAADGQEVLQILERQIHDIVLMDLAMKPMDGVSALEIIRDRFPSVQVIAISMHDDTQNVVNMYKCGASGYLLKNADVDEIEFAVKAVSGGEKYFSKELSCALLAQMGKINREDSIMAESAFHKQRIKEILFLICHELTSAEIGNAVCLSARTVDDYRKELLDMTGSRNTVGIVKYALANRIDKDMKLIDKFKGKLQRKQSLR